MMNLIYKVFNVVVPVNFCCGGTVKRDTTVFTKNDIPSYNLDPYYPYYQYPYHYHHPREALCGALRNLLQVLFDSGVTPCQQLPKDFQGKICSN